MEIFKTKTLEELEKERDKLKIKTGKKEELDKVKKEIKELKGKSSNFNKEKVLEGWKGVGKGILGVIKTVGKQTTKFAEGQKEFEERARKMGAKETKQGKGKQTPSNSFGFEPGAVSAEEAFGMQPNKKNKGRDKDAYIF